MSSATAGSTHTVRQIEGDGPDPMMDHSVGFGGKTIGTFAGFALLINNITGPGVPGLPNMFSEAGWLSPTLLLLLIWSMSSLSATMYCEAMRRIPGNEHFRGRLEYTSIVSHYFGRAGYIASQIGLNGALQSLNIVSVIQSAQVMDQAIAAIFKKSCGVNLSPFKTYYNDGNQSHIEVPHSTDIWTCVDQDTLGGDNNPWGCHLLISAGFLVTLIMAVPAGYFNLDDNMIIQVVAFVLTVAIWIFWLVVCFYSPAVEHWSLPMINDDPNYGSQANVLGTILFNFGFVTTIPSWVNEKKPSVSVNKVVWSASFTCVCIFFLIGVPGAVAFYPYLQGGATKQCQAMEIDPDFNCANDLMSIMLSPVQTVAGLDIETVPSLLKHAWIKFAMKLSVYLFPIVATVSSIPVFSIVIKYNCLENGWSKGLSSAWGVLFPWIISIPLLYQPDAVASFINFTSLFFVSFTDFVVPWCLYILMARNDVSAHPLGYIDHVQDLDLLDGGFDSSPLIGGLPDSVIEHFAVPVSWGIRPLSKIRISGVLVVLMTGLSIAGIVLTILTGASIDWDCATVGAG